MWLWQRYWCELRRCYTCVTMIAIVVVVVAELWRQDWTKEACRTYIYFNITEQSYGNIVVFIRFVTAAPSYRELTTDAVQNNELDVIYPAVLASDSPAQPTIMGMILEVTKDLDNWTTTPPSFQRIRCEWTPTTANERNHHVTFSTALTTLAPSTRNIGSGAIHGRCEIVHDPNTNNDDK